MILTPGHFYASRNSAVWCCFRVDKKLDEHCQARCIRISDYRVEYFYLDGRYDRDGKREHTLVDEVEP